MLMKRDGALPGLDLARHGLAHVTDARTDYGAYGSHGDLALIPKEERKIIFIDKPGGRTVTIKPHLDSHDTFAPRVHEVLNSKIKEYLTAPAEKLFSVEISTGGN